ncbi:hypothetical protein L211DRAFT_852343 [Terfezia boudieri ATCC MYA-4762]|uniref:Uncharacterized protein n=1 Tax=Terfezia boudieri ATCC MYA-4762 TaxID=1051890 RepID=A0A3N4LCG6_9PEZI|nr:hypothetical protein L211DRAFT_852343 [Terfezia boudieri ATCC MYA-4762]
MWNIWSRWRRKRKRLDTPDGQASWEIPSSSSYHISTSDNKHPQPDSVPTLGYISSSTSSNRVYTPSFSTASDMNASLYEVLPTSLRTFAMGDVAELFTAEGGITGSEGIEGGTQEKER